MTREDHQKLAALAASSGAKYKILVYDGQYVDRVEPAGIITISKPRLLDASVTKEILFRSMFPPWQQKIEAHLKKCELVDVELRILKDV